MPKKILVYWRDIPSQVIVKRGRNTGKAQLSQRFQEAIDRAAMRAGKGSSDAYLEEWRRVTTVCDDKDDPQVIASREVEELERQYTDEQLTLLIKSHGKAISGRCIGCGNGRREMQDGCTLATFW